MNLLELFCCQGGAGMGYSRAGFDHVVGVDNTPQPRYPFHFVMMDALEALRLLMTPGGFITDSKGRHWFISDFDAIHASPPCQGYSVSEPMKRAVRKQKQYPMLIEMVRGALIATGLPYVIENVEGAPLFDPLRLTGAMFGLKVIRARLFEINPPLLFAPPEQPQPGMTASRGEYERGQRGLVCVAGNNFEPKVAGKAMGIDWMTRDGLAEAIPPAYTEHIGLHLLAALAGSP